MVMEETKANIETTKQEVTVDGLLQSARGGEENLKAAYFKQLGVREFLEQLNKEGYEVVKKDESKEK